MIHTNLGSYHNDNGDAERALEHFEKAVTVDPLQVKAFVNMARMAQEDGKPIEAQQHFISAVAAADALPVRSMLDLAPYYYYATFLEERARSEQALELFEKAAHQGSDLAEPHLNLGIQYHKRRQLQKAYDALHTAVSLRKNYLPALYQLAGVSAELGRIDEAISLLEAIERRTPNYEKTRQHLLQLRSMKR